MNFINENYKNKNSNRIGVSSTLKMLTLVVAITFSSFLTASPNPNNKEEPVSISESVEDLLQGPNFQLNEDVSAVVKIFINQNSEIVVLSIDTDNETVETYIKSRLNYQKLSKRAIGNRKLFKISVKVNKSI